MIEHKQYFNITGYISLIVMIFLLGACASGRGGRIPYPEWYSILTEHAEEDCYYVPINTEADLREAAADEAAELLFEKMMEVSGKAALYDDSADKEALIRELRNLFFPEVGTSPLLTIERSEWIEEGGYAAFFAYFCIPRSADTALVEFLGERHFGSDETMSSLLAESGSYEEEGLLYQAAETLLKAAAYAADLESPVSLELADSYIKRALALLQRIDISVYRYPTRVEANTKVENPFSLRCMEGIIGIRNMEFLVQYKGRKRDGSIGTFEVRIVSDVDGYVSFYHPFLPFAGESEVIMSPGSRNIHTILRDLEPLLESAAVLKAYLDDQAVVLPFTIESSARNVPTGIVVLHTDMTGTNLNSSETATGLRDVLLEDGFDAEIMKLSPLEITASNEETFLRDLKAAYSGQYNRVIYGVVGINDFNIRNDLYMVETSGVLKVADLRTGEILMVIEQSKSVESKDNALAVAASFSELGKAIAEEVKSKLY